MDPNGSALWTTSLDEGNLPSPLPSPEKYMTERTLYRPSIPVTDAATLSANDLLRQHRETPHLVVDALERRVRYLKLGQERARKKFLKETMEAERRRQVEAHNDHARRLKFFCTDYITNEIASTRHKNYSKRQACRNATMKRKDELMRSAKDIGTQRRGEKQKLHHDVFSAETVERFDDIVTASYVDTINLERSIRSSENRVAMQRYLDAVERRSQAKINDATVSTVRQMAVDRCKEKKQRVLAWKEKSKSPKLKKEASTRMSQKRPSRAETRSQNSNATPVCTMADPSPSPPPKGRDSAQDHVMAGSMRSPSRSTVVTAMSSNKMRARQNRSLVEETMRQARALEIAQEHALGGLKSAHEAYVRKLGENSNYAYAVE
eukprot:Rmarinus@m.16781